MSPISSFPSFSFSFFFILFFLLPPISSILPLPYPPLSPSFSSPSLLPFPPRSSPSLSLSTPSSPSIFLPLPSNPSLLPTSPSSSRIFPACKGFRCLGYRQTMCQWPQHLLASLHIYTCACTCIYTYILEQEFSTFKFYLLQIKYFELNILWSKFYR